MYSRTFFRKTVLKTLCILPVLYFGLFYTYVPFWLLLEGLQYYFWERNLLNKKVKHTFDWNVHLSHSLTALLNILNETLYSLIFSVHSKLVCRLSFLVSQDICTQIHHLKLCGALPWLNLLAVRAVPLKSLIASGDLHWNVKEWRKRYSNTNT